MPADRHTAKCSHGSQVCSAHAEARTNACSTPTARTPQRACLFALVLSRRSNPTALLCCAHLFCTKLDNSPVLALTCSSLRCPPVNSCSMLERCSPLLLPAPPAPAVAAWLLLVMPAAALPPPLLGSCCRPSIRNHEPFFRMPAHRIACSSRCSMHGTMLLHGYRSGAALQSKAASTSPSRDCSSLSNNQRLANCAHAPAHLVSCAARHPAAPDPLPRAPRRCACPPPVPPPPCVSAAGPFPCTDRRRRRCRARTVKQPPRDCQLSTACLQALCASSGPCLTHT